MLFLYFKFHTIEDKYYVNSTKKPASEFLQAFQKVGGLKARIGAN